MKGGGLVRDLEGCRGCPLENRGASSSAISSCTEGSNFFREARELIAIYIKELAELAGINEPIRQTYYKGNERIDDVTPKYALLGTHAGRRTFICNALALGIPPQVVMKWTGHSDYKAMKPYIDIADDIKANAMSKFNQL